MGPKMGGEPTGELAEQIKSDFGSFASFKSSSPRPRSTIMGSGWAALVWEPLAQRLLTTQIYDHQSNLSRAASRSWCIDAWEHAWYLQYENRKAEFFEASGTCGTGTTSRSGSMRRSR